MAGIFFPQKVKLCNKILSFRNWFICITNPANGLRTWPFQRKQVLISNSKSVSLTLLSLQSFQIHILKLRANSNWDIKCKAGCDISLSNASIQQLPHFLFRAENKLSLQCQQKRSLEAYFKHMVNNPFNLTC